MVARTRKLVIREICDEDLNILWSWRNTETFIQMCSTRRNKVSLDEFKQELTFDFSKDRYQQLIGVSTKYSQAVGTIWAYNMNKTDGHAFLSIFIDPRFEKYGYGVYLFMAQMIFLFDSLPFLHKIYTEAYSYNNHSIQIMKKFGFSQEGFFAGHRVYNGERFGLCRLAFYREQLKEKQVFIKRLFQLD